MPKTYLYIVLYFFFFTFSCQSQKKEVHNKVDERISNKDDDDGKSDLKRNNKIEKSIENILSKMKRQETIVSEEYDFFCDYILNFSNESMSEEIGYHLFEFLQKSKSHNEELKLYLNTKKGLIIKDKAHSKMIDLMCIDISENYAQYDEFILDFIAFQNSKEARVKFEKCLLNNIN